MMVIEYFYGFFVGFIIAITGAWKDTLFEKFNIVKFFRSPLLTEFWYLVLLLSLPGQSIVLIMLSAATLERFTTEIYKAVRRQPPGKFKNKHKDSGWVFERVKVKHIGMAFILAGLVVFLLQLIKYGTFFDVADIASHETLGLVLLSLGLPTLLWGMNREKN